MAHEKTDLAATIETDQAEWLTEQTAEFGLPDDSKALRILIDYAMEELDAQLIFASENARCRHCG